MKYKGVLSNMFNHFSNCTVNASLFCQLLKTWLDVQVRALLVSLLFIFFESMQKKEETEEAKLEFFSGENSKSMILVKAFPADMLRQDHGWIISDESFRVYKNEFDEIRC